MSSSDNMDDVAAASSSSSSCDTSITSIIHGLLTGESFTTNHIAPTSAGVWTHGTNSSLSAGIQAARYPLFPMANRSLVRIGNGMPFPHRIPLHATTDDFASLSFPLKSLKRKRCDAVHPVAAASSSSSSAHDEARGTADGMVWNLMPVGVTLKLSSAFKQHDDMTDNDAGLGGQDAISMSQWGSFIDGYRSFWTCDETINTLEPASNASMWLAYCKAVLRMDAPLADNADNQCIIFSHPSHNSFAQIAEMADTFRLHSQSTSVNKVTPRIAYMSLYMICMQFWLFCNDRFIMRTRRDGPDAAVFAADQPAFPFVLNCEADLPTNIDAAPVIDIGSSDAVVDAARTLSLGLFVMLMMDTPAVHSISPTKDADDEPGVHEFFRNYIKANREKVLLARKFTVHPIPNLIEHIKSRYDLRTDRNSAPIIRLRPTQQPGGDGCTPATLNMECACKKLEKLMQFVPSVYSHMFMGPTAPLFSTDGAFTQANYVCEQETRDIRMLMRLSAAAVQKVKKENYWSDAEAMMSERSVITRLVIGWMQFLPYVKKTDIAVIDKCITRAYTWNPDNIAWKWSTVVMQEIMSDAPVRKTSMLPSSKSNHTLATLPRCYDPIVPNASHLYAVYQIRTAHDKASPVAVLYRYIRQYEYVTSPHHINVGDQHILKMPLEAWLWIVESESVNKSRAELIDAIWIDADVSSESSSYIPAIHRDAWLHFASQSDVDYTNMWYDRRIYSLYVYISHFVKSETELIHTFISILNIDINTAHTSVHVKLFSLLQSSAQHLFQTTIAAMYDTTSAVNPYQVFNSFGMATANCDAMAIPHARNLPFVGRFTDPPADRKQPYNRLFQFEVAPSDDRPSDSLHRTHQLIRDVMHDVEEESIEEVDRTWSFAVRPMPALVDKYRSSYSVRSMIDELCTWSEDSMSVSTIQLVCLCIVSFNVLVLDVISVCMDYQLPISLVQANRGEHWYQSVSESDIFTDLDLDSYHNDMDHQVDTLSMQVERFFRDLNTINPTDKVARDRSKAWAYKNIAYFDVLHLWITSRQRTDKPALDVLKLRKRMVDILDRQDVVGVSTGLAVAPITAASTSAEAILSASMKTKLATRITTDMRKHDAALLGKTHVSIFTPSYYQACLYDVARATNVSDPVAVVAEFRSIIRYMRDNVIINAQLEKNQNSSILEVRAMLAVRSGAHAPAVIRQAASSSSSSGLFMNAIVHPSAE